MKLPDKTTQSYNRRGASRLASLRQDESGVTLVELLVALIMVGILLAIYVTFFMPDTVAKAQDAAPKSNVANAYHASKVFWRDRESFQPLGTPTAQFESLIKYLKETNPGYTYSTTQVSRTNPELIMVGAPHPDVAYWVAQSRSGRVFCLEAVERDLPGVPAGLYWSSGFGTMACGDSGERIGGTVTGGTNNLPDGPTSPVGPGGSDSGQDPGGPWTDGPNPLPFPPVIPDNNKLFPAPGIIALQGLTVNNSAVANSLLASNAKVGVGNSSIVNSVRLGPGAPAPSFGGGRSTVGEVTYRTAQEGPWVLHPLNYTSANNNNLLPSNVYSSAGGGRIVAGSNTRLTLQTGVYLLCSIQFGNNSRITVAPGATVKIIVDSPDRPGSNCPAGSGTLNMGQNFSFVNNGVARQLQFYAYGYHNGTHSITWSNSGTFRGVFYAPRSLVTFVNSATIYGGAAARQFDFKNGLTFTWDPSLNDLEAP